MQRDEPLQLFRELRAMFRYAARERILREVVGVCQVIDARQHRVGPHFTIRQNPTYGYAAETDTVFLNRFSRPGLRALRTKKTTALERQEHVGFDVFATVQDLYFGGDMEASIALSGQVAGRIDGIKPVKQIIDETIAEFGATVAAMNRRYG